MTTLSLELPDDLAARLGRLARERGVSRSLIVREAIAELLGRQPGERAPAQLARDLVGSLRGGPADLSTHPDHVDGFGGR